MTEGAKPYNPLHEDELGKAVTRELESRPLSPLPPNAFLGTGLYALYFHGTHPAYADLVGTEVPIYVGKAEAGSGRHGRLEDPTASNRLFRRMCKHAASIEASENLRLSDFACRYLVMSDAWIVLGEQGLLRSYQPLWNLVITGFGNNPPGAGRMRQVASRWDTMHPGRDKHRTERPPNPKSEADLIAVAKEAVLAGRAKQPISEHLLTDENVADDDASSGRLPV